MENLGLGVWGRRSCGWGVGSEELGSRGLELGGLGSGVLGLVKLGSGALGSGRLKSGGWRRGGGVGGVEIKGLVREVRDRGNCGRGGGWGRRVGVRRYGIPNRDTTLLPIFSPSPSVIIWYRTLLLVLL